MRKYRSPRSDNGGELWEKKGGDYRYRYGVTYCDHEPECRCRSTNYEDVTTDHPKLLSAPLHVRKRCVGEEAVTEDCVTGVIA